MLSIMSATTWGVMGMDQRPDVHEKCSICGDALKVEERADALCEVCTEAWEREVESHW
jgi:hypothetical protein